jgi:hypothetical protein
MLSRKIATFAPENRKRTTKSDMAHYTNLFLGAFFLLLVMSCSSSTKWNDLEFYNVEKLEQLTEAPIKEDEEEDEEDFAPIRENSNREMDVKVDMQFIKSDNEANENVCNLINGQLIEILLKQSSDLSIDEAVEHYIEDVKAEFHGDEVANVYYDHLTGRAEYGKKNVLNYRMVEEVFTGGAHPCTITTILRFDAMTGEYISLDQVFPTSNQMTLRNMLLDKLMKDNDVQTIDELHEKGFLEMIDMFVSSNFALREDSIEFYYNEYDIAPYAYGPSTICLGYEEVKPIISTTFEK